MKLLIITQTVDTNDPILGFFRSWIAEFSRYAERVFVIGLSVGSYEFPPNVTVYSLGKEKGTGRVTRLAQFYLYLWRLRGSYDQVFVHMNPIYVVLGGLYWKIAGKKVALWYTHKSVDTKLRIAEKYADDIFTASQESFRLPSKKVRVMGHGIDTDFFSPSSVKKGDTVRVVTWGRISPTKNIHILIDAFAIVHRAHPEWKLVIIGPYDDTRMTYMAYLRNKIRMHHLEKEVTFTGPIRPAELPGALFSKDILVNLSATGSMDKSVLEAMSAGLRVLTSNEAFFSVLPRECATSDDPREAARKLEALSQHAPDEKLRTYVIKEHGLSRLIKNIFDVFSKD